jgi:hypothetical protein
VVKRDLFGREGLVLAVRDFLGAIKENNPNALSAAGLPALLGGRGLLGRTDLRGLSDLPSAERVLVVLGGVYESDAKVREAT